MIKKITTFFVSFVVVNVILNTTLNAQEGIIYCISSHEQLIKETEKKQMLLVFSGMTKAGMPLWFFRSDTDFTVFFKDQTGKYCTTPNHYGTINRKGYE
jgi:hypothetical protein